MASPMMPIGRRDLSGTVDSVKSTFTSWDACMSKAYCKWPVIAAIVVGGLIVFSVLYCLCRCICCGAKCCCGCLSCCNSCCPGGNGRHRRVASPPPSSYPSNAQYQSHPPPMYSGPGWRQSNTPQFATFDAPSDKKFNEDALPPMPSWDDAHSRKVEMEATVTEQPGDMEMQRLDEKGRSATNSSVGTSPMKSHSPPSEYGFPAQPQPQRPQPALTNGDLSTPNSYRTMNEYQNGQDNGYFNGQPPQPQGYGPSRHASPAPQGQPYHYANDPYGQQSYGHDNGGGYDQHYDGASSVGGYAPSHAPTGYAPSGSTRYEPSVQTYNQDPYYQQQHPPMPPVPPIDRAGTASPYQSYGHPRPPLDRAATSSPYQAFNSRPPIDRAATTSPYVSFSQNPSPSPVNGGGSRWERFGANRNDAPGGFREV